MHKPLKIVKNTKDNLTIRQLYGLKENEINDIYIEVEEIDVGSKYSIVLYEESKDFISKDLTSFEYYGKEDKGFHFSFRPGENVKRININFICYEGSISINKLTLNNKIKPLEYSILPSDLIFRFEDFISGSTSLRDRIHYNKDGFKLWLLSPVFGLGGEGFNHLYKEVQTLNYTSSEAHNSILQVFIESGVIGGISLCLIIYLTIAKGKFSGIKISFIMFIIHSITDLNFSYLISLIIFSVFIGLIESKKE